jgi:hypothetical protein
MSTPTGVINTSGITHLTIEGKEIQIRFGLPACQAFYEMVLSDESRRYIDGTALTAEGIAKLLFAGYCNNCLITDEKPTLTAGQFLLFVEDQIIDSPQVLRDAVEVFGNSKYTKKMNEQAEESLDRLEESKKKLTGTSLNLLPSTNSGLLRKNTTPVPTENFHSGKRGTNETKPKRRK